MELFRLSPRAAVVSATRTGYRAMLDDANRDAHAVYCLVQSDFGGASGGLPLEHSGRQLELFDIQSRAALRQ